MEVPGMWYMCNKCNIALTKQDKRQQTQATTKRCGTHFLVVLLSRRKKKDTLITRVTIRNCQNAPRC